MKKLTQIFIFCFALNSFLIAKDFVIKERTNAFLNKRSIASLTILTPIKKLKTVGDFTTIKIKGFRLENYPQIIVRDMQRKETYMEFSEEDEELAKNSFKILKQHEDEYGEIWHEVEGEFQVKNSSVTNDIKSLEDKAKKSFATNCSMCHRLHPPSEFTVNQWPHQIESMMSQIPMESPIKELVIKYLQQNAADAK